MSDAARDDEPGYPAERLKAFADAVVAIAMTLLILPLLESVTAAGNEGLSAGEWLGDQWGFIVLFVTSFAVIAMFWLIHHRLFTRVERVTPVLIWLVMGWLLTIVWLPIATDMTGAFDADAVPQSLYIGSMIVTCLISVGIRVYLRAHPDLHGGTDRDVGVGLAVDFSMITLFAIALVVAVLVPGIGYFALFLLALTGVVERLYARLLAVGPRPENRRAG